MFRISNEFGFQEPYWGKIDPVEAIHRIEERQIWKLKPEEANEEEKIRRVHNYRFVREEREEKEKQPPPQILAMQIMSFPVVTLTPDDTLEAAWDLLNKTRFRHIPILNKEGLLVGILSDRTLLHALHLRGGDVKIKEVMTTKVISATPDTPIHRIVQLLFIERIGAMPITDEAGRLVGLITRSDILRTLLHYI